uniref:Secreted protein n=1 Tax=Steinernema glaseri TaxID=37863 RepID=A0A1I7Z1V3_9BILA
MNTARMIVSTTLSQTPQLLRLYFIASLTHRAASSHSTPSSYGKQSSRVEPIVDAALAYPCVVHSTALFTGRARHNITLLATSLLQKRNLKSEPLWKERTDNRKGATDRSSSPEVPSQKWTTTRMKGLRNGRS